MKDLGYYDGETGALDEIRVPMLDRGCYFGDGIYEAAYSRNHIVYSLDEHIARFYKSAALLDINIKETPDELSELIQSLVMKVDSGSQLVYWQATRGVGIRDHAYDDSAQARVWVMLRPREIKDTYTKVKLITAEDKRFLYCNIKTLNLIPSVLYTKLAQRAGCYETVLHRGERVTECAHSNVHILKNGVLRTAPADEYILAGVARGHLISMCGRLGIPVDETAFTLKELRESDEIIVTSSSAFCMAAEELDGVRVGGGAPVILKTLQDALVQEFINATDK